jgi:hypothetical protein
MDSKFVIIFLYQVGGTKVLIWDLENDMEERNYDIKDYQSHAYSNDTNFGYALGNGEVFNLDVGLPINVYFT